MPFTSDSRRPTNRSIARVHPHCRYFGQTTLTKGAFGVALNHSQSQDSFYKPHSPEDLKLAFANQYDFDHPDAIDMASFASVRLDA